MDLLSFILGIVQAIVYGAVILVLGTIGLLIAVSVMPKDNPLRQFLASLLKPVGTMAAVAVVGVPVEFIPGIDVIYDIIGLIVVGRAWIQFFQLAPVLWPQVVGYFEHAATARASTAGGAMPPATECFRRGQEALQSRNYLEALRWFRMAAEQGHAKAKQFADEAQAHANEAGGGQRWQQEQSQQRQEEEQPRSRGGRMTRAEALEVLELKEGATTEAINAAWKHLMTKVHPDKGGSTYFAKQLNEAREVLLG
jgi:hypothetical protein